MNKTLLAARLDYITIAPYLTIKNFALFAFIFLFLGYFNEDFTMAMSMLTMYGLIFASYPFAVGDKNGIDTLYFTLPVKRSHIVRGRYLFSLSLVGGLGFGSYLIAWTLSNLLHRPFYPLESLTALLVAMGIFTLVLFFQLPIFFRLGYSRAKFMTYIPLAILTFGFVALGTFLSDHRLSPGTAALLNRLIENPLTLAGAALLIWLAALLVSVRLSLRFYTGREF